jgi:Tfp pilus assembly protein PilN
VLRTNLSTRPFYNERAVHAVLGLVALLVLIVTAFNVFRIVTLSRQNTEISRRATRDRSEADRLTQEAVRVRKGLDQTELKLVAAAAREANVIIDQRTFSWTEFFNRIEATLPPEVMLSAVRPRITDDGTRVTMMVVARRAEDVDEFMEKLEATGAFEDVLPTQEELTDDGMHKVVVEAFYTPAAAEPSSGGRP